MVKGTFKIIFQIRIIMIAVYCHNVYIIYYVMTGETSMTEERVLTHLFFNILYIQDCIYGCLFVKSAA